MFTEEFKSLVEECIQLYPDVIWLDLEDYLERSQEENWVIVDVRNMEEREISIIPGTMSGEEFSERSKDLENTRILFYCTVGCRSGARAEEQKLAGFQTYNLWGGILAWALSGHNLITPEGETTKRVHVYGEKWAVLPSDFEVVW